MTYSCQSPESEASLETERSCDTLVLAIGNTIAGDDGLGIEALKILEERYSLPDELDLVDGGTMGLYLIDRVCGYRRLLVLDSVLADETPGTVIIAEGDDVQTVFRTRISAHQQGVNDLLSALTLMDKRPEVIAIVGMVPQSIQLGVGLSKAVSENLPRMADAAAELLQKWSFRVTPR